MVFKIGIYHKYGKKNIFSRNQKNNLRYGTDSYYFLIFLKKFFYKKNIQIEELTLNQNIHNDKYLDAIIFIDDPDPNELIKKKNILTNLKLLLHRETNVVLPETWQKDNLNKYDYIFSYNEKFLHSLVDLKKVIKVLMPRNLSIDRKLFYSEKRKNFSMILRNKAFWSKQDLANERNNIVDFFEKNFPNEFDLYGADWDKYSFYKYHLFGRAFKYIFKKLYVRKKLKVYKGLSEDKLKTISDYKFNFCYENTKNFSGYISEKIFDSFRTGSIPIYYGTNDVEKYIPNNLFIDAKNFSNLYELRNYCNNLSSEEISKKVNAIKKFLRNKENPFSTKLFTLTLYSFLIEKFPNKDNINQK
tara:strand:+ start:16660 stop:17733 length:1074 start_codon:yes stop_codon:yes gene_type:complete